MQTRKPAAFAAAVLLFVSGGGLYGEAASSPAGEEVYEIEIGGWESGEVWRVDRDGNEVPAEEAPEYVPYELTDAATEQPRYELRTREEMILHPEGWASPDRWRSLWSLDGNLLIDWERMNYTPAFGEYIIRQDARDGIVDMMEIPEDYHSALYHVPTGKESYIGAFSVDALAGGDYLLLDKRNRPMGVVNAAAETVSGFPAPEKYFNARAWGDLIEADNTDYFDPNAGKDDPRRAYLLDRNFNEVFTAETINTLYTELRGDYAAWRDGEDEGIYTEEDGVLFKVTGSSIEYFDGELAIVQTGEYRGEIPIDASLVTKDNKALASGFSWLRADDDSDAPAKGFLGIKDGKAVRVDRTGAITASSEAIPDIRNVNRLCDGLYSYDFETETSYGSGVLDADMKVLIPAGQYGNIYLAYGDSESSAGDVLLQRDIETGSRDPANRFYRSDILDHTGKLIVGNVTTVHASGPDRIAITRGFNTGLMDWSGNWIVKRRIFDNAMED